MAFMQPAVEFRGIVIIVGNYGSGKTEVAINLAIDQRQQGRKIRIADLDLVNAYFRTREARRTLTDLGIEVILPPEGLLYADLPVLSPQVSAVIRQPDDLTILDVGGDDVGATVLAALADVISNQKQKVTTLQVVNPHRPATDTLERCQAMRNAIEKASKVKVDGWIGNANLIDETTVEQIEQGYAFMQKLAETSKLPLAFFTLSRELWDRVDADAMKCPLLMIQRQLVPPWKKPSALFAEAIK
jgi:hypothetical protein